MYSFHSSPEEKNKLLFALTQHGIETTVDRVAKKKRIRDWIQESVIQEEDEEEEEEEDDDDGDESDEPYRRNDHRAPVAGHVSSVRAAEEKAARTQIVSTVKDASNKHINPRTGKIQQGPSEMGHHSGETHANAHHSESNGKALNQTRHSHHSNHPHHSSHSGHANPTNHMNEMRKENNGYEYQARRATKLVDVGSQTSNESQKQFETVNNTRTYTPERPNSIGDVYQLLNSHSVPTVPNTPAALNLDSNTTQNTQTNINRMDTTSRGFMSAFNSLATIAVPETLQQPASFQRPQPISPPRTQPKRTLPQTRQSYQHRHNTTGLIKQPISRSVHNFNSLINDSGYGSLDKLRPFDANANAISTPVLSKRSVAPSKLLSPSNNGGASSNERIHINGMSHSQNENGSPFHSDSGGDGSPRGSNGFVNHAGTRTSPAINELNYRPLSKKDTVYDRVRSRKQK